MEHSSDVLGQAWWDYWQGKKTAPLLLHTSYGTETEEMSVDYFFREETDFPPIERYALNLCRGQVLDVGAGTGVHAAHLLQQGLMVSTLEVSPIGVRIQRARGIKDAILSSYQDYAGRGCDTVLLLMNGIGVVGTLDGLRRFLQQATHWLRPGGQLLFDSSDIAYLYEEHPRPTETYYGEVRYCYEYRGQRGSWFGWLYVDFLTLEAIARETGWRVQLIFQEEDDQYLARLIKPDQNE